MKKINRINTLYFKVIAMLLVFQVLPVTAGGVPQIYAGPLPSSAHIDRNPEAWDWTKSDAFSLLASAEGPRGISTPWNPADHFGMNISANMPLHKDGWRLVSKKFTCIDSYSLPGCPEPNKLLNNYPYFTIYNIYSGLLRTFIYIDTENFSGADTLYAIYDISEVGAPKGESNLTIGWKSNELEVSNPRSSVTSADLSGHETYTEFHDNDWFILDVPFSYAAIPTGIGGNRYVPVIPDNLALRISLYGIDNTDLKITGDITFLKDGKPIGGRENSSSGRSLDRVISAVSGAVSTYNQISSSVESVKSSIDDTVIDINSKASPSDFDRNLASELNTFGNLLTLVGPAFPAAGAAGALITAFSSTGSAGSSSVAFDSASLELDGSLTSRSHLRDITIGIPRSDQFLDGDKTKLDSKATTQIDGYIGHLGVFSLPAAVSIYESVDRTNYEKASGLYFLSSHFDVKDIEINRSLKDILTITDINYQLEVRTNVDVYSTFAKTQCSGNTVPKDLVRKSENMVLKNKVYSKSKGELRPDSIYKYKILGEVMSPPLSGGLDKLLFCIPYVTFSRSKDSEVYVRLYITIKNKVTGEDYSYIRTYPVNLEKKAY